LPTNTEDMTKSHLNVDIRTIPETIMEKSPAPPCTNVDRGSALPATGTTTFETEGMPETTGVERKQPSTTPAPRSTLPIPLKPCDKTSEPHKNIKEKTMIR